jgi:hypothetical protein
MYVVPTSVGGWSRKCPTKVGTTYIPIHYSTSFKTRSKSGVLKLGESLARRGEEPFFGDEANSFLAKCGIASSPKNGSSQ